MHGGLICSTVLHSFDGQTVAGEERFLHGPECTSHLLICKWSDWFHVWLILWLNCTSQGILKSQVNKNTAGKGVPAGKCDTNWRYAIIQTALLASVYVGNDDRAYHPLFNFWEEICGRWLAAVILNCTQSICIPPKWLVLITSDA
jgi:hypothetical protein